MLIEKVISGSQTGADQGGLEAALELGLPTGGWIPKGFLTEEGKKPELGEKFNLTEHESPNYVPRTYTNVRDSDATIIFSSNWQSRGTICTQKAIQQYNKPFAEVPVTKGVSPGIVDMEDSIGLVKALLKREDIKVLNVAGNRESVCPGIQELVKEYMLQLLRS